MAKSRRIRSRRIPHFHQRNNYYCGPAAVQMVVAAFGKRATQGEIAAVAGTTKKNGTSTLGLVKTFKSFGLKVEAGNDKKISDVQRALAKGAVVIVCYTELHWNWGHYAIVAGVRGKTIKLIDPAESLGTTVSLRIEKFAARWNDPLFTKSRRWAAFIYSK